MEHVDEVEKLLKEREDDLEKLIAISHVKRVLLRSCGATKDAALRSLGEGGRAAEEGVTRARLEEVREGIERDAKEFRELLNGEVIPHRRRSAMPAVA